MGGFVYHYGKSVGNPVSEEDVIDVLEDVRKKLNPFFPSFKQNRLLHIAGIVEDGRLNCSEGEIDVSEAKKIVDDYKLRADKGCMSCVNFVYNEKGRRRMYCKLTESDKDVIGESRMSPRIARFYDTGCIDAVTFCRPLNEVLSEVD